MENLCALFAMLSIDEYYLPVIANEFAPLPHLFHDADIELQPSVQVMKLFLKLKIIFLM